MQAAWGLRVKAQTVFCGALLLSISQSSKSLFKACALLSRGLGQSKLPKLREPVRQPLSPCVWRSDCFTEGLQLCGQLTAAVHSTCRVPKKFLRPSSSTFQFKKSSSCALGPPEPLNLPSRDHQPQAPTGFTASAWSSDLLEGWALCKFTCWLSQLDVSCLGSACAVLGLVPTRGGHRGDAGVATVDMPTSCELGPSLEPIWVFPTLCVGS